MSKTYLVGGAVRDRVLGREAKDQDWVIVGETVENMNKMGYMRVGEHFPVYLLPNGDELAMARTERSTGDGYNDFVVDFNPTVTIEEDLYRRDFTINAIAFDESNHTYIDPYGGLNDIAAGIIRMVNPNAFRDDPLRVFRAIRFTGRYDGFEMECETRELVIRMVKDGALKKVSKERVFVEFMKCYEDMGITKFVDILYDLGLLAEFGFDPVAVQHAYDIYEDEGCMVSNICNYCKDFEGFLNLYNTLHLTKEFYVGASVYFFEGSTFDLLEFVGAAHDTPKLKYAMNFVMLTQDQVSLYRSVSAKDFPDVTGKDLGIAIKTARKKLIEGVTNES